MIFTPRIKERKRIIAYVSMDTYLKAKGMFLDISEILNIGILHAIWQAEQGAKNESNAASGNGTKRRNQGSSSGKQGPQGPIGDVKKFRRGSKYSIVGVLEDQGTEPNS